MNAIALLVFILLVPYLVVIFSTVVQAIYLWQIKEYRLDRVWSHYQYEGSLTLNDEFELIVKIALVTVSLLYYFSPFSYVLGIALVVAYAFYFARSMVYYSKFFAGKIHRPKLKSVRNILILGGIMLIVIGFYTSFISLLFGQSGNLQNTFDHISANANVVSPEAVIGEYRLVIEAGPLKIFSLPILLVIILTCLSIVLDLITPILVAILVFLTAPLAKVKRSMILVKARNKFANFDKIVTIAVTGSYGKTTTKELLAQLSVGKFNTIATHHHNNTDIGIAKTVLKLIKPDTDLFIAEMGAYKLKETADCARITPPDLVIVTGLDEQHFSLYGGIQAIIDSTLEIEEFIKPGGMFVINGDDEYCAKAAHKVKVHKVLYYKNDAKSTSKDKLTDFYYGNLKSTENGIDFDFSYRGETGKIFTKIKVEHNIGNLVAGIICLLDLGLKMSEIINLLKEKKFELPYMNVYSALNGSSLIDDGYNINPSGYSSALRHLKKQKAKGRKWVLTQGFIELGPIRDRIYAKLARETIESADAIMTTDSHFSNFIHDFDPNFNVELLESVFELPAVYNDIVVEGDVVLLEGPLPDKVLKKIKI